MLENVFSEQYCTPVLKVKKAYLAKPVKKRKENTVTIIKYV